MHSQISESAAPEKPAGRKSALLVAGIRKGTACACQILGGRLLDELSRLGFETESITTAELLRNGDCAKWLSGRADSASILILAFPVCHGSLPAQLVKLMEGLARERVNERGATGPMLAAVLDRRLYNTACARKVLDLCQLFAKGTGMAWAGGIVFSSCDGEMPAKNFRKALRAAALALSRGGQILPLAALLSGKDALEAAVCSVEFPALKTSERCGAAV